MSYDYDKEISGFSPKRKGILDLCLTDRLSDESLDIDYLLYEIKFAKESTLDKLEKMISNNDPLIPNKHNSTLLWALGLTDELVFDKRVDSFGGTPADIDMDFPAAGRSIVYNYVRGLYGKDCVSKIGTINTFGIKELVGVWIRPQLPTPLKVSDYEDKKEYERAMISFAEKEERLRTLERNIKALVPSAINGIAPDLKRVEQETEIPKLYPEFWKFCKRTYNQRSRQGVHAGGLLMMDTPISDHFPLYRGRKEDDEEAIQEMALLFDLANINEEEEENDSSSKVEVDNEEEEVDLSDDVMLATQFDKDDVEKLGGLKIDILVTDILDIIQLAFKNIRDSYNINLTMKQICDLDPDPTVYEMLNAGYLQGVFQMETSETAVHLFNGIKPTCISEISDINALNRPGPLDSGIVKEYINNKKAGKPPKDMPPVIAQCFKDTHYAMIYQEQVMKVFSEVAGMSLRETDDVRRAMGKKDEKYLSALRPQFVAACLDKKVCSEQYANDLFKSMLDFASYAFNRSHAVTYSHHTFVTAWLKAHYPAAYFAAYLTIKAAKRTKKADEDKDQFQLKLAQIKSELEEIDIKIMPPDINSSGNYFSFTDTAVNYSLRGIKSVSKRAVKEIVNEREANGPYKSIIDFTGRVNKAAVNIANFKALVSAGTFDNLNYNRTELLNAAEDIYGYWRELREYREYQRKVQIAQETNKKVRGKERTAPIFPSIERYPARVAPSKEELKLQMKAIGCYLGKHPSSLIQEPDLTKINKLPTEGCIRVGAVISHLKEINTNGGKMAFISLQDDTGEIDAAVFASTWASLKRDLVPDAVAVFEILASNKKKDGRDKQSYSIRKLIKTLN